MNKSYQNIPRSQEDTVKTLISSAKGTRRSRKKCKVSFNRPYAKKIVHRNFQGILRQFDETMLDIIRLLLKADNNKKFSCIALSQQTIADEIGKSRDTVSEKLRTLNGLGLIKSYYRHMRTCIYVVSSIFYIKNHRSTLKKFFPLFVLLFSSISSDTNKILSSSYSSSSRIYKDYLVRDYAQARHQPKILGNTFKNAIMKLLCPPPVYQVGTNRLAYLRIVARRNEMEKKFKDLHNAIDSISEIDLSLYGKCKLTIFTPEAIQSARWKMRDAIAKKRAMNDPFQIFFSLCEAASLKRGERRDYETFRLLNLKYNFLSSDEPLKSKKVSIKSLRKTKQPNEYKSLPKEPIQTVQELEKEYTDVMNNLQLQERWRLMPSLKEMWLAAFDAKMAAAKENDG